MKNIKLMRKFSFITLALLLMFATTFSVSASYVWYLDGYNYSGTVTNLGSVEKTQRSPFSATHTNGRATTISATSLKKYTQESNGGYREEYEELLEAFEFASSVNYTLNLSDYCTVDPIEPSGRYYLTVVFPGNSLRLQVSRFSDQGNGNMIMDYRETQTSSYVPKMNVAHVDYTAG